MCLLHVVCLPQAADTWLWRRAVLDAGCSSCAHPGAGDWSGRGHLAPERRARSRRRTGVAAGCHPARPAPARAHRRGHQRRARPWRNPSRAADRGPQRARARARPSKRRRAVAGAGLENRVGGVWRWVCAWPRPRRGMQLLRRARRAALASAVWVLACPVAGKGKQAIIAGTVRTYC